MADTKAAPPPSGGGTPPSETILALHLMSDTDLRGWYAAQVAMGFFPLVRTYRHPEHDGMYPDPSVIARMSFELGQYMALEFRRREAEDLMQPVAQPLSK